MDVVFALVPPGALLIAMSVAALAGLVKGLVGFAMPMVLISGLGFFLPPELALAGLILPTVATNIFQSLAQGWRAALASVRQFGVFLGFGLVFLLGSAQLVTVVHPEVLLLLIGGPICVFAVLQLLGVGFRMVRRNLKIEAAVGSLAGFLGGLSGIWGPPTVAYLTALNTPKADQMRVQGVVFGLGAVALVGAHVGSGVLTVPSGAFSAVLVVPALLGMAAGTRLQPLVDQKVFRRMTLVVLLIAGLNLLRRGLMGL
ncbi:MAG: sulfite exporter TauE/SafE family protein [Rhodobacteraceae bacterium]|nr:sulfite exporter TauE/SafE family protein [Paracoccaceae bacterium]